MDTYFAKIEEILRTVIRTQKEAMGQAAECFAKSLITDHKLFLFGTGHSHMLAEEAFYRAGGLMDIVPILESGLMLHEGATKSTKMERMEGYAEILLDEHQVAEGDVLVVISNSGRNAVPIEMALGAKSRGAKVIAVTNLTQSLQATSRHRSGKKLYEVADIVLDNCGCDGDAAVYFEDLGLSVGPSSTVIGAFIINGIIVQTVKNCLEKGYVPPIYMSANVEEGDDHNAKVKRITRAERMDDI
ncbi:sugar isomerase domain-containing protein [Paenibacillus solisilvae]|uniref:Sugar isomerase domain-containing protein n=1 Tax=Paenibacillus solisilvae TaxID=2486751 RepID=A0ABW0W727_9BACL